jgi:hypothetical protein
VLWHVSRGVVGSVGVEWQAWVSLRVRWCGVLTPGPNKNACWMRSALDAS